MEELCFKRILDYRDNRLISQNIIHNREAKMRKILLLLLPILMLLTFCCKKTNETVDTDGDGMSDELEAKYFNPEVDPALFNPKISDLPILDIDIYDVPQLSVNYIETKTSSASTSVARGQDSEYSRSASGRVSTTVSATVKSELSLTDMGVSGSATVSGTVEVSREASSSIRSSIEQSREWAQERSLTAEEAKISVPVFIKNIGNMPVSIKDLTLTAYSINIYDEMEMIGSLKAENFGDIYLQPNNESVIVNFQNDSLYPSRIEEIMLFSKRIVVVPASYDMDIISNDEVVSYHEAYSAVKAKTARVHIKDDVYDINSQDFDNVYDIAVESLEELFEALHMEYETKDGWIYVLDGQRGHNTLSGGEWEIKHTGERNKERFNEVYNSNNPILDVDIQPKDKIFIYRTIVNDETDEEYSISHQSISSFNAFGDISHYITDVDKEVKLRRNSERGVYQEIYLDIEPQRSLIVKTTNDILFEFHSQADLGGGAFYEIDPNAEETEYTKSFNRSPKRVFINGKEVDISPFYEPSEMANDPGMLELDLDKLGFPEGEKIETIDFYFTGGANPDILPYTPRPSEEGAKASWYDLPHIETYIFCTK